MSCVVKYVLSEMCVEDNDAVINIIVKEFVKIMKPVERYFPEKIDIFVRGNWTCLAIENDELCFEKKGESIIISKLEAKLYVTVARINIARKKLTITFERSSEKSRLSLTHIRALIYDAFNHYIIN